MAKIEECNKKIRWAKFITLSTETVQAIRDGKKTTIRKVVEPQPQGHLLISDTQGNFYLYNIDSKIDYIYPEYQIGDNICVIDKTNPVYPRWIVEAGATNHKAPLKIGANIFLKVTDVRVERLQDITEDECYKEGYDYKCPYEHSVVIGDPYYGEVYEGACWSGNDCNNPDRTCDLSIPEHFGKSIWNPSIKKRDLPEYGWDANPWVWVIEFERNREKEDENA